MSDLNHFEATARLATEPKIYRSENSAVTRLFAIIHGEKDTPVALVAFGKDAADYTEASLHRGSQIKFEGELSQNEWLKDGEKRTSLEIALRPGKSKLELLAQPRQVNGSEPE